MLIYMSVSKERRRLNPWQIACRGIRQQILGFAAPALPFVVQTGVSAGAFTISLYAAQVILPAMTDFMLLSECFVTQPLH